jgi:hypothetical protein
MSRSASQLDSLTTRDTLNTRSHTLEFGAGPLAGRSVRQRGSHHSHNRPFRQREAMTR